MEKLPSRDKLVNNQYALILDGIDETTPERDKRVSFFFPHNGLKLVQEFAMLALKDVQRNNWYTHKREGVDNPSEQQIMGSEAQRAAVWELLNPRGYSMLIGGTIIYIDEPDPEAALIIENPCNEVEIITLYEARSRDYECVPDAPDENDPDYNEQVAEERGKMWLVLRIKRGGQNGRDGVDGTDGRDGTDGADGSPGTDGRDGQDGVDGEDGKPCRPCDWPPESFPPTGGEGGGGPDPIGGNGKTGEGGDPDDTGGDGDGSGGQQPDDNPSSTEYYNQNFCIGGGSLLYHKDTFGLNQLIWPWATFIPMAELMVELRGAIDAQLTQLWPNYRRHNLVSLTLAIKLLDCKGWVIRDVNIPLLPKLTPQLNGNSILPQDVYGEFHPTASQTYGMNLGEQIGVVEISWDEYDGTGVSELTIGSPSNPLRCKPINLSYAIHAMLPVFQGLGLLLGDYRGVDLWIKCASFNVNHCAATLPYRADLMTKYSCWSGGEPTIYGYRRGYGITIFRNNLFGFADRNGAFTQITIVMSVVTHCPSLMCWFMGTDDNGNYIEYPSTVVDTIPTIPGKEPQPNQYIVHIVFEAAYDTCKPFQVGFYGANYPDEWFALQTVDIYEGDYTPPPDHVG